MYEKTIRFSEFTAAPLKNQLCFCKLKSNKDGHLRDLAESFLEGNVQQSSAVFLKNTKK